MRNGSLALFADKYSRDYENFTHSAYTLRVVLDGVTYACQPLPLALMVKIGLLLLPAANPPPLTALPLGQLAVAPLLCPIAGAVNVLLAPEYVRHSA